MIYLNSNNCLNNKKIHHNNNRMIYHNKSQIPNNKNHKQINLKYQIQVKNNKVLFYF